MNYTYDDELYHFGIHGMKWGVRRYQNEDGTLTEEGKRRYQVYSEKYERAVQKTQAANEAIARAKGASERYRALKNDEFARKSGEAKEAKREAKKLGNRKAAEKLLLDKKQAEWETAKYKKKLDQLQGVANNVKVSAVSPKAVNAGKQIAKSIIKAGVYSAISAATASVGVPVATFAGKAAADYASTNAMGKMAYKLAGIDSIGEAAIEGGRAAVDAMLGITYLSPTQRAVKKAIAGGF